MESSQAQPQWNRICRWAGAALLLAGIAGVFLTPPDFLFGSPLADIGQQFLAWRAFAAESLRSGHWPLWNPNSYAGEPFLGGFQSAVFYPPNVIFLVLPLCRATNLSLLLHLFILGGGMYRWANQRGLHPLAAGLAGLLLALSGPVFPHLFAGHLSNLCTLAWAPWIFAGLEDWNESGHWRGLLLASAAVCMQIFAGQIQYVFYTAVATGLHAVFFSLYSPKLRRRAVPAAAATYVFAAALAAVQLLPGLAAAAEGLRQGRLDAAFAGQFSFPPENFLTLVVPGFFGDPTAHLYWGRCYSWEMSLFIGVSGTVLLLAALSDPLRGRSTRMGLAIAGLLLVLSLGQHTPLFRLVYDFVPGFGRFRGWSKFTFPAVVFLAMAVAEGADGLIHRRLPGKALVRTAGLAGIGAGGVGLFLFYHPTLLTPWLVWIHASNESYLSAQVLANPDTVREAGTQAGRALVAAGGLAVLVSAALVLARRRPLARWFVLALLPIEMADFAASQSAHFRPADAVARELRAFVADHPGDYRVQNLVGPNNGFLLGAPDIWGNDPGLLKRYAEFMAYTQGADPNRATQNVTFRSLSPLYRMLRLRYVIYQTGAGVKTFELPGALDRIQLVSAYRIQASRDGLFSVMSQPDFDPRQTVLLESEPDVPPSPSASPGTARILSSTSDQFTVAADLTTPSILLVTDAYSRDWQAHSLPGSAQSVYRVTPADYVLRATPLTAGHHLIRFDYFPRGLTAGVIISALAWTTWAALRLAARSRAANRVQEAPDSLAIHP